MVGHLVDNIQLLDSELIDLVQHIYAGNIATIAFDDVDQLVNGGVAPAEHIGTHDLILSADHVHDLVCEYRLRNHGLEVDGALLFSSVSEWC